MLMLVVWEPHFEDHLFKDFVRLEDLWFSDVQHIEVTEFPLWLSGLRTWHSVCEDTGSIPGLAQWVKYPYCISGGIAQELPCATGVAIKKKKKKKKRNELTFFLFLTPFFWATHREYGSSWAKDWIQAAAATQATAVGFLTHCAMVGSLKWT